MTDTTTAPATPAAETVLTPTAPATTSGAESSPAPTVPAVPAATPSGPPPVDYKLQLPESAAFTPDAVERAVTLARELNLTPEAAQKVLNHYDSEAAARLTAAHQALQSQHAQQVADWRKATLSDPSLGKTPDERKAAIDRGISVLDRYAKDNKENGEKMRTFLNESGFGNHPVLAHFFSWLGKAASEPQSVPAGEAVAEEGDWRVQWFPNTYKKDSAA